MIILEDSAVAGGNWFATPYVCSAGFSYFVAET